MVGMANNVDRGTFHLMQISKCTLTFIFPFVVDRSRVKTDVSDPWLGWEQMGSNCAAYAWKVTIWLSKEQTIVWKTTFILIWGRQSESLTKQSRRILNQLSSRYDLLCFIKLLKPRTSTLSLLHQSGNNSL